MDENFSTRRRIYGDKALGEANLEMVAIAQRHDSCVKFAGSGGAVFGICNDPQKKVSFSLQLRLPYLTSAWMQLELKKEFQEKGFVFCDVQVYQPEFSDTWKLYNIFISDFFLCPILSYHTVKFHFLPWRPLPKLYANGRRPEIAHGGAFSLHSKNLSRYSCYSSICKHFLKVLFPESNLALLVLQGA